MSSSVRRATSSATLATVESGSRPTGGHIVALHAASRPACCRWEISPCLRSAFGPSAQRGSGAPYPQATPTMRSGASEKALGGWFLSIFGSRPRKKVRFRILRHGKSGIKTKSSQRAHPAVLPGRSLRYAVRHLVSLCLSITRHKAARPRPARGETIASSMGL